MKAKSFQHRCIPIGYHGVAEKFILVWWHKGYKGELLRRERKTDWDGARRFCKKWGMTFIGDGMSTHPIGEDTPDNPLEV